METVIMKERYFTYLDGKNVWFIGNGPNGEFGKEWIEEPRHNGKERKFRKLASFSESPIVGMKEYVKDFHCDGGGIIFLAKDGTVYVSGREKDLEVDSRRFVPIGNEIGSIDPLPFPGNNVKIASVACGSDHMIFSSFDGLLYGKGSNRYQQLGSSNEKFFPAPARICEEFDGVRIRSVEAFTKVSFCISEKGVLYSWGFGWGNTRGRILNRVQSNSLGVPTNILFKGVKNYRVLQVVAGVYTIYAIVKDLDNRKRYVYFWGSIIDIEEQTREGLTYDSKIAFQMEPKRIEHLDEMDIVHICPFKYMPAACYAVSKNNVVYQWNIFLEMGEKLLVHDKISEFQVIYVCALQHNNQFITRNGEIVQTITKMGPFDTIFGVVLDKENEHRLLYHYIKVALPLRVSVPIAKEECLTLISNVVAPLFFLSKPKIGTKRKRCTLEEVVPHIGRLGKDEWVEIIMFAHFYHISFMNTNEIMNIIYALWKRGFCIYQRVKKMNKENK